MIEKIIIVTLLVYAIHYAFLPGEIFGFVNKLNIPERLQDPLFACNVCMTPWWGTNLYWLIWHPNVDRDFNLFWIEWLVVVFSAMGLNGIVNKLAPDK